MNSINNFVIKKAVEEMYYTIKHMKTLIRHIFFFIILLGSLAAQINGKIEGVISDQITSKPLPYANVFIDGTSLGSASDLKGNYSIPDIPPGSYTIKVRYIGYKNHDEIIVVQSDSVIELNCSLNPVALEGEMIEVTVQAEGQKAAINQQLSSKSIVNVVSSARIQELADANAAESIGRLPGVSVTRVGGEGTKVVIRGIAPKYNAITLDGVRMASSDANNRSADLSMISSNMLEGIEVYKTLTADQDADVIGGTVNFKMKAAEGGLKFHFLSQGGWSGLSTANNDSVNWLGGLIRSPGYNNYKIVPSLEGRILDDRLGIFVQANFEKRDLTSNTFSASYDNKSNEDSSFVTNSINLSHIPRIKERINIALVLDYRLPNGKINFSNFGNSGITETISRSEEFNIGANSHNFNTGFSKSLVNMLTNTLRIENQFSKFHANFKFSHSYSETTNPNDWSVSFFRLPAGLNDFYNRSNVHPKRVVAAVLTDSTKTKLNRISSNNSFTPQRNYMSSLDFKIPVNFSKGISAEFKIGGKFRTSTRSYRSETFGTTGTFTSPSERGAAILVRAYLGRPINNMWSSSDIKLNWFIDSTFTYPEYIDEDYNMNYPLDFDMIKGMMFYCQDSMASFKSAGSEGAYARNNYSSTSFNYSGEELLSAMYIMSTIKLGQKFIIIPGLRYQNLETEYSGIRGNQSAISYYNYNHIDTTINRSHLFWLPNLNIQYKPLSWFDIRMAYSTTISYPDFNTIIPRIHVGSYGNIQWNNYDLTPSKSDNYDLYFTFYENKIGLFTIGGFVKKINDLIYPWKFSKAGLEAEPYFLTTSAPNENTNYTISTYINNPYVVYNKGLEIDWQTHFWYLPDPLSGLVLNINYTTVKSEAEYPFVYAGATSATNVDTSFTDRLVYQPDHIFNFSLGYDYKGFSILLSMLYQDDVFSGVSQWPQLRSTTAEYKRWDLSVKQTLPWLGMQLYGNLNNINGRYAPLFMKNAKDMSVLQMYPDIPKSIEDYGMTAEMGFRIKL